MMSTADLADPAQNDQSRHIFYLMYYHRHSIYGMVHKWRNQEEIDSYTIQQNKLDIIKSCIPKKENKKRDTERRK